MRHTLLLILILLLPNISPAQQAAPTVKLDLSDADITQALASISQQANVSILGDSTVTGKVTCSLSGLTVDQALDAVCKMNKLQWYKTYTGADTLSADKLLKVVDALGGVAGTPVICTDPQKKTRTVFIPDAGSVDTSALVSGLKLKEVYLVRAIPATKDAATADKGKTASGKSADGKDTSNGDFMKHALQGDAKAVGDDLLNAVRQMPMDQQYKAISHLRHDFLNSLTPQQRQQLLASQNQPKPKPKPRPKPH